MVAKIVSGFSPVLYIPCPMGATQLAHTPKGAPKSIPTREWTNRFFVFGLLGYFEGKLKTKWQTKPQKSCRFYWWHTN